MKQPKKEISTFLLKKSEDLTHNWNADFELTEGYKQMIDRFLNEEGNLTVHYISIEQIRATFA